jgi:uncharacterized protein (TIGR02266 family)
LTSAELRVLPETIAEAGRKEGMSWKKKVLIVCQSAAGQMYLGVLLNRIWYAPVLAKTPAEGVELAQETQFSLVLYDADVSELELRPAIDLLKNDPALNGVPLIVFITNEEAGVNDTLLARGCAAILTKPLDLAIVYGVLGRLSGQPRSTFRAPAKMRVEIQEQDAPEKVLTSVNISEGGLYLRTLDPLPGGTVLQVKFTLPHDTEAIACTVEVVRALPLGTRLEAEPGMGLRFIDLSGDNLGRIRNYIQWEMMGDLEWRPNI